MPFPLEQLGVPPQGFPECRTCPYLETGSGALCYACASRDIDTPEDPRCPICEQSLGQGDTCWNRWCRTGLGARHFTRVWAIARYSGDLKYKLRRYKYQGKRGWASIFGRIVVGHLDDDPSTFRRFDWITGSPSYDDGSRPYDHIRLILGKAAEESINYSWPFDVGASPIIVKNAASSRMASAGAAERRRIAREELRPTLEIPETADVAGKRVLVFDDVFTEGSTLREIARALKSAGAAEVSGLVLARTPQG